MDPRSGVAQELAAGMRYAALSDDAQRGLQTKMDVRQMNRSALERMMAAKQSTRGAVANLMAGQPLANLAGPAAALQAAAAYEPPEEDWWDSAFAQALGGGLGAAGGGLLKLFTSGAA